MRTADGLTRACHRLLAELMIPDGVHDHSEDWTVFFLNQTPGNTIASIFTPGEGDEGHDDKSDLLHVLNLVRTKHDKTVRRYVREPFVHAPCSAFTLSVSL